MIKKLLCSIVLFSGIALAVQGQTATNFTCNDCQGNAHDLFSELDSGKVIVLAWVMPCGACSGPSLTAYNLANSYQSSHPNRVFFYLADDYANTSCASLNSWANSIGIPQNAYSRRFVNAAIDMLDYGSTGMPKIVVLGGTDHTVFYNANNSVSASALQNAINAALSSTGISEKNKVFSAIQLIPNPVKEFSNLQFQLMKPCNIHAELYTLDGKKVKELFTGEKSAGEHSLLVDCSDLNTGTYLVKLEAEGKTSFVNLAVSK